MPELSPLLLSALIATAFVAGFFSAIAGAGGMITLPVLMAAGLPPITAIGTNKVQSAVGTLSSTINFFRKGHINLAEIAPALGWALLGTAVGVVLVRAAGNQLLEKAIPIALILVSVYFLFSPRVGDEDASERLSAGAFNRLAGTGFGVYGGAFGPGMATFLAFAFVSLRGFNLGKATAHTKPLVLMINGASAIMFAAAGDVLWLPALSMAAAQFVGARLGSNLVISKGAAIVRPMLIGGCLLLALKLLFSAQ